MWHFARFSRLQIFEKAIFAVIILTFLVDFVRCQSASANRRYDYVNKDSELNEKLKCVSNYACNVKGANLLGYFNVSDSGRTTLLEVNNLQNLGKGLRMH